MKKKLITRLKGTRDLYPNDLKKRRTMLDRLRKTIESYGYDEYDAPLLEPFELYSAKSSPEIIERQSYVFDDRGGDRIVVRPEMTPSLARMIAAKQRELPSVLRWYSFSECWRYERPQKGRLRNFLQVNVDLIGSDSVEADVEAIDLALGMMRELGTDMSRVEARVNDRRLLESWVAEAGVGAETKLEVLSLLDEKNKLEPDDFRFRLAAIAAPAGADFLIRKLELSQDGLSSDENATRLRETVKRLADLGWKDNVKIDPTVIRGFAYYTGVVFEVYETSGSFKRAAFGGGRYDKLVEALGGAPVSGVGFGVSDVSLEELMRAQGKELAIFNRASVPIITNSEEQLTDQGAIAARLRKGGVCVETSLPPYGFSPQLKLAQKKGARFAILLAPEEMKAERVIVRDLKDGRQSNVAIDDLVQYLKEALSS